MTLSLLVQFVAPDGFLAKRPIRFESSLVMLRGGHEAVPDAGRVRVCPRDFTSIIDARQTSCDSGDFEGNEMALMQDEALLLIYRP